MLGLNPLKHATGDLTSGEVSNTTQHVVQPIATRRPCDLRAVLQIVFDALQGTGVDQLTQLLLAQQLAQQIPVERQRGGLALGVRRVALVHVRRHIVEQQR